MAKVVPSGLPAQLPAFQFKRPTSENAFQSLGAGINYLLEIICPIGSIIESVLDEADFQALQDYNDPSKPRFILADGRDVTGYAYVAVTGSSTVPDLRGIFLRGKNNGRSDGNQNPAGDLAIGTLSSGTVGPHSHTYGARGGNGASSGILPQGAQDVSAGANGGIVINTLPATSGSPASTELIGTSNSSGAQTQPTNVTINIFIRVN